MSSLKLVMVEWVDSRQPISAWQFLENYEELKACECRSVGFLVKDSDNVKVLAQNIADDSDSNLAQASGAITIPYECIKKVTELKGSATLG